MHDPGKIILESIQKKKKTPKMYMKIKRYAYAVFNKVVSFNIIYNFTEQSYNNNQLTNTQKKISFPLLDRIITKRTLS